MERKLVALLCFSLDGKPRAVQFSVLTFGVFFFYLLYGYFQEYIFRIEGLKEYGWFVTLVQFGYYVVFGFTESALTNRNVEDCIPHRKVPLSRYVLLAVLTVGTMGLSNSSLGYLNYPTQVIFKCCKLIPVLIGGVLIQGKRHTWLDVLACVAMSVGLVLFTLADSSVSPNFNPTGIAFISLALCFDAVIGNVQEKVMKAYEGTSAEMVLYSYALGFVYLTAGTLATGELARGVAFCRARPGTYLAVGVFSLTGYLGVNIVLTLVKTFGALPAVTVTTCRKAVTIVLSFLAFTKPFTFQYVWSGLVVCLGIYLNVISKRSSDLWSLHQIWKRLRRGRRQLQKEEEMLEMV